MLQQRKYDEAAKYFSAAIKADPRNAVAYKGMGYAMVGKGDKARALQYLKYAAQLNPSDTQLAQYLASLQGSAGSSIAEQHYQNGRRYMQARQYQYAAYYFYQATKADPNSAKTWQGLGNAYYAQGSRDKALQAWERAVALDPSNTQLAQYVANLKGQPTSSAETAPSAAAQAPAEVSTKQLGFNPWVMGITIAALGGIILFLF